MNTSEVFLYFQDDAKEVHFVSIDSILYSGHPIDAESGNDMEQVNTFLYEEKTINDKKVYTIIEKKQ